MPELKINLQLSKQFIALLVLVMFGCQIIIFYLPLNLAIKFLLWPAVLMYGYKTFRSYRSITQLQLSESSWQIYKNGQWSPATLTGDSTVTTWVSVLRFTIPTKRFKQSCVIWNDSLDPETYRRLIVAARWLTA